MKKDKTFYGWIFAVIVLSMLLLFTIYLSYSGFFYRMQNCSTPDMKLGQTVELAVTKNAANSISFSFSGSFLPGETLPETLSVKNLEDETDLYLRARAFVYTADNQTIDIEFNGGANWVKYDDGYYYLTMPLTKQNKTGLCSGLVLSDDHSFGSNKNYILTILCETLSTSVDTVDFWAVDIANLNR